MCSSYNYDIKLLKSLYMCLIINESTEDSLN